MKITTGFLIFDFLLDIFVYFIVNLRWSGCYWYVSVYFACDIVFFEEDSYISQISLHGLIFRSNSTNNVSLSLTISGIISRYISWVEYCEKSTQWFFYPQ